MSVKAVILMLLVIVALGVFAGPGMRRMIARALGLREAARPQGLARRIGRAVGRSQRGD